MKKKYDKLPTINVCHNSKKHIGIIGCGNFTFSNIAYYLKKNYGNVIEGAMDIDINKAASVFEKYQLSYYTDDAERIIYDDNIDNIFIASNHASHAEYAIKALEKNKNVHIEKPHVVNYDQLKRLANIIIDSRGKVNLGFNRPLSKIGLKIKEALKNESGPAMINWFIAGHQIEPDHWYYNDKEGGRILGNLCHWTDFTYRMVDSDKRYPIKIIPAQYDKCDTNIAVSYVFGDGTIAAITFSAKGHTFEGVREKLSVHRGNLLLGLEDYKTMTIEVIDKKKKINNYYREHGHEAIIKNSYNMSSTNGDKYLGLPLEYIWETGELFLKTKDALDTNKVIIIETGFTAEKLEK